jgi:hypothetical protein
MNFGFSKKNNLKAVYECQSVFQAQKVLRLESHLVTHKHV